MYRRILFILWLAIPPFSFLAYAENRLDSLLFSVTYNLFYPPLLETEQRLIPYFMIMRARMRAFGL